MFQILIDIYGYFLRFNFFIFENERFENEQFARRPSNLGQQLVRPRLGGFIRSALIREGKGAHTYKRDEIFILKFLSFS